MNQGGLSIAIKVLEIKKTKGELRMGSTGGEEIFASLKDFLKEKIGSDVKLINTFSPMESEVDFSRVEIIDLPVTGKERVKVGEIDKLKTEYYPLGVVEFINLTKKNKQCNVPDLLKKESLVFLFAGTTIVNTVSVLDKNGKEKFVKKEFFPCALFYRDRFYRDVQSVDELCNFKTLVVKRPKIQ